MLILHALITQLGLKPFYSNSILFFWQSAWLLRSVQHLLLGIISLCLVYIFCFSIKLIEVWCNYLIDIYLCILYFLLLLFLKFSPNFQWSVLVLISEFCFFFFNLSISLVNSLLSLAIFGLNSEQGWTSWVLSAVYCRGYYVLSLSFNSFISW